MKGLPFIVMYSVIDILTARCSCGRVWDAVGGHRSRQVDFSFSNRSCECG